MSYGLTALRKVSLQEGAVRDVSAQKGSCAWLNQSSCLLCGNNMALRFMVDLEVPADLLSNDKGHGFVKQGIKESAEVVVIVLLQVRWVVLHLDCHLTACIM